MPDATETTAPASAAVTKAMIEQMDQMQAENYKALVLAGLALTTPV
ncbi:hypothetical protein [Pseudomonas sp. DCA-1]